MSDHAGTMLSPFAFGVALLVTVPTVQEWPTYARQNLSPNAASDEISVSLSADGRFVAFESRAPLVPGDSNRLTDIYLLDLETANITLVTRSFDGLATNGSSARPRISGDARFVVFDSVATRLVPGDGNERSDVFIWDRSARSVQRISTAVRGQEANGSSARAAINSDGRVVAFQSLATNLVPGEDNNGPRSDVYVYQADTGQVSRVSVTDLGMQPTEGAHYDPGISGNGHQVVFTSSADLGCPPLPTADRARMAPAIYTNVYVRDLRGEHTRCVSQTPRGEAANGPSYSAATDGSGTRVAYVTHATNLGFRDSNRTRDVVVQDLQAGTLDIVSRSIEGRSANGPSWRPVMSSAGRYVAFVSVGSDLMCRRRCPQQEADVNLIPDVYLLDTELNAMRRVSSGGGAEWWAASRGPALNATATVIAFSTSQPQSRTDESVDEDLCVLRIPRTR